MPNRNSGVKIYKKKMKKNQKGDKNRFYQAGKKSPNLRINH